MTTGTTMIARMIYKLCIVSIFAATSAVMENDTRFSLLERQLPFEAAMWRCQELGDQWGLPNGQNPESKDLEAFMAKHKISSCWLGVRKFSLQGWRWVDGSLYEEDSPWRYDERSFECAGLSVPSMSLAPLDCAEQGVGMACQFINKTICPEDIFSQSCFRIDQSTYMIGCNSQNWYHAREICKNYGGDLAVVKSPNLRESLLNFITTRKLHSVCDSVFVGLLKQEWQLVRSSLNASSTASNDRRGTSLGISQWSIAQPRQGPRCAFIQIHGNQVFWKTNKCDNPNYAICQNYGLFPIRETEVTTPASLYIYLKSKFGGTHWFGISITLAILLLLLLASTYIIHKWRERQRELAKSLWQEEAQINCFGLPNKVQRIKAAKGHIVTVAFISSKLEKLQGVKIMEIDWPGNESRLGDLGIGNEVAKEIVMVFNRIIEELQETLLRIVHIKVNRPSNEFPVLPLLKYLADNSNSIDVLVTPNFSLDNGLTTEMAKRALELLKEIKKDTVVVCASRRYNDIPSREVIAVGVVKGDHTVSEVYSGTDFVVDLAGEKALEANYKDGPAKVAGIAAAIICILKIYTSSVSRKAKIPKDVEQEEIEQRSSDNTDEELITDKEKAEKLTDHIKTTAGMRQLLLELLQREEKHDQQTLGDSNPYWAFGKLVLPELNLKDAVVVKKALESDRPAPRVKDNIKACFDARKLEQDKHEAIMQLEREVFEVSESTTQQGNSNKEESSNVSNQYVNENGHDEFWIKIAIVGRGIGNGTTGFLKLSTIQDICRDTADQLGVSVMSHVLSSGIKYNVENRRSLSEVVGFRFFPILDEGMNAKWDQFGKLLEGLCKENYDVIHIYGTVMQPAEGYQIGKNLKILKQKSVVITCSSDNTLPANFPSESAISVRSFVASWDNSSGDDAQNANGEKDALLDKKKHSFVPSELKQARKENGVWKSLKKNVSLSKNNSQNPAKEKIPEKNTRSRQQNEQNKIKSVSGGPLDFLAPADPQRGRQMGSYYATAVVGLIMLRAKALKIPEDQAILRNTAVMHSILRAISSHPDEHTHTEGWGVIYPWILLKDKDEFREVITEYTGPDRLPYFWDGKNI